jgi:hypothetical protein
MSTTVIKSKSGAVLWEGEATSMRDAVEKAVKGRAYLDGANLTGANLTGANLAHAYLAHANLTGAYLAHANLTGADLNYAYLDGAYLDGANLTGANLTGANLAHAYLNYANLTDANLTGADLAHAYLNYANLTDANLTGATRTDDSGAEFEARRKMPCAQRAEDYRRRHPDVPVVAKLDQRILDAIAAGGSLEMGAWHTCETTHCRAGWAIHFAGKEGAGLEAQYTPAVAGRMIYLASTGRAPHFYSTNARALEDIRRCAAEDAAEDAAEGIP